MLNKKKGEKGGGCLGFIDKKTREVRTTCEQNKRYREEVLK